MVGLVEPRDGGAAPGWRLHAWEHDDEAVLRGWSALFDAWTLLAPVPPPRCAGSSRCWPVRPSTRPRSCSPSCTWWTARSPTAS